MVDIVIPTLPKKYSDLQDVFDRILMVVNGQLETTNLKSEMITVSPILDPTGVGIPLQEVAVKHTLGLIPRYAFVTVSGGGAQIFEPRARITATGEYDPGHTETEAFFMFNSTWSVPVQVLLLPGEV